MIISEISSSGSNVGMKLRNAELIFSCAYYFCHPDKLALQFDCFQLVQKDLVYQLDFHYKESKLDQPKFRWIKIIINRGFYLP